MFETSVHAGDHTDTKAALDFDGLTAIDRARLLSRHFAVTAANLDRDGSFPFENFRLLHQAGLASLTAPRVLGGADAGLSLASQLIAELARGEPSTALILAMQYVNLATLLRGRFSSLPARQIISDAVAKGALVNSLRVEPQLGSPTRGGLPETTARRTESGWSISGRKIYSTGSVGLTWMIVWAKTDEVETRVGRFLVPASSPGVSIEHTWDPIGMRATASHDVVFDAVAIPPDYAADVRLPQEWQGKDPLEAAWSSTLLGCVYDGIAVTARDWVVRFLNNRRPSGLGAPLSSLARVQEAIGEIETLLFVNRQVIGAFAGEVDKGILPAAHHA
ncbi:MAG: acyl-CoA dehydrogenase family protein, partial [Phyllobacterium sp.]